jgi:RNA polymerase sigma-70 factor (ECF subfamily)
MREAARGMNGASAMPAGLAEAFEEHRGLLWGLGYRLTGSAADADDVVQETFLRAVEHPPPDTTKPWRPWLVRVAVNLGRDVLRRRRRRRYVGPWLPSPIETDDAEVLGALEATLSTGETTEGRYDLLESVSYAFLLALEALTPRQRAVLLLRDVFDYGVRDTAEALGSTEGAIKVTHHRARRAMADYDRRRVRPTASLQARTRAALESLMRAFADGDVRRAEALLAADVRAVNDGGGEFVAARVPILGRERVARFYGNVSRGGAAGARVEVRMVNGLPAMVLRHASPKRGIAPVSVTSIELDADGLVAAVRSIVATRKLTALRLHSA